MVLGTLKSLVSTYWPHLLVLLVTAAVIAWKLRLMKKLGFYLVGVGAFFFSTGIVSAGNPILLLIGNAFFLAGLVLIFGLQRTRVLRDIVLRGRGTRAGLLRAGWVILLVIAGELLNNVPIVWRFYPYIPVLSWVTRQRSDGELCEMAGCEMAPAVDPGEGRSK